MPRSKFTLEQRAALHTVEVFTEPDTQKVLFRVTSGNTKYANDAVGRPTYTVTPVIDGANSTLQCECEWAVKTKQQCSHVVAALAYARRRVTESKQ